jgi:hypothetical protein
MIYLELIFAYRAYCGLAFIAVSFGYTIIPEVHSSFILIARKRETNQMSINR